MSNVSDRRRRIESEVQKDSRELTFQLIYEWVKTGVCSYREFLDLLNVATFWG
jgi:hypothetical protein